MDLLAGKMPICDCWTVSIAKFVKQNIPKNLYCLGS